MSPTAMGADLPQWCGKAEACPQALLGWLYLTHDQNDQVCFLTLDHYFKITSMFWRSYICWSRYVRLSQFMAFIFGHVNFKPLFEENEMTF